MWANRSFLPEQLRVFLQCGKQQQPESAAAHNFADEDGEREQRNRLRHFRYFAITNGMMIVFAAIGGSGASHAPRGMPPGRVREVFSRVSEEQKFRLRR